ncbi:MAG: hypothetical protein KY464_09620 [Gemmatimonadetes bacterium]|nr:hypothetical protein [Gemmatimonadota bacterium]
MNPLLKTAAKHALPHLATMTRGRRKKMLMKAGKWAAGQVMRKKSRSMRSVALKGLGAAAVAVPVGMWLGRKLLSENEAGQAH